MSLSQRLRNIAMGQINALKERLDRIDEEAEHERGQRRAAREASDELNDPADLRPSRRSREDIASGRKSPTVPKPPAPEPVRNPEPLPAASALGVHYRILGVAEGSDLNAVEAAYNKLAARCAPDRFPDGSEEQLEAREIFKRVDAAYDSLRDALDATAGRFDKLELE